ncbi:MAG: hypothetical protein DMD49_10195 [Gemmatimonadetes bacterium]|nr:MAG: hypothetical protein DMD49_10195 [Gemmatimonadota bacterium]
MRLSVTAVCLALCAAVPRGAAQQPSGHDAGPALATRQDLESQLARLARDGRAREAALVRSRLDSGDFQAGDRIYIRVDGEKQLTDTFTVGPGPTLTLPQMGDVPLGGTLRSELRDRVASSVARYIRDPAVQARPLIRILVEGDVGKPGFYAVPPELPLADVIGAAGGLTQRARATGMRVQRGRDEIWGGELLQQALGRGSSLDQLNLRAGDRVFVPARGDGARTLQILGLLVTIPAAIFTLTRIR